MYQLSITVGMGVNRVAAWVSIVPLFLGKMSRPRASKNWE